MTESSGRQLAAIMFTDVVGYTELTERDEARALGVRDRHRAILQPLVAQFEGELLEAPGDECLSVFASARLAVDCALALQAALRAGEELRLRAGIHLGDVLRRNGELIGEGVNVAARIRPLAPPGGVCVSEAVWKQVRGREGVAARSLGAQRLKNVSEPVVVYALGPAGAPAAARRWRRRLERIAVVLAVLAGMGWWFRAPLATAAVFWGLRAFAPPLHQDLGFTTTADGLRIAYATSGHGPPLVMVLGWVTHLENGNGSPLYDGPGLISAASREHFLVRYDGRGFGLSDRDVQDFGLDARVRDIEAVVDALHLSRFSILAQSAGGPASVAYTARHPERVERLVLASTMVSLKHLSPEGRATLEHVLPLVESDWHTPGVPEMFSAVLAKGRPSDVWSAIGAEWMRRSSDGPQIAGFMHSQLAIDASAEAAQIRTPTLVIHARDDEIVSLEFGRELAALIPGARFEIIDGGHMEGTGSTPETMNRILAFIDEGAGPR